MVRKKTLPPEEKEFDRKKMHMAHKIVPGRTVCALHCIYRYAMHIHIHIECRYSVMSVMSVSFYGPISVYGYNIVIVVSACL